MNQARALAQILNETPAKEITVSKEFKLIVAGGRDFNDYELLTHELKHLGNETYADKAVSIVSGMASGADALAVDFAREYVVHLYEFPADWDNVEGVPQQLIRYRNGKPYNVRAGHARNARMAMFADGLLAFWDGKSKGTQNMIESMKVLGKPVHVIRY